MATILEFIERWKRVTNENSNLWTDSVMETEEQLLDVNREQLLDGKDKDGADNPDYSNYMGYGDTKMEMNPRNRGYYDMNLTGNSFRNMLLYLNGRNIEVHTSGEAAEWDRLYGGRFFGIGDNIHLENYRISFLYPQIIKNIKNETGAS